MSTKGIPRPVVAFLDTNVFLHYQPFDQIKWPDQLSASEVVLAVSPVVLSELDKHKDTHSLARLRDRARAALARIRKAVLEEDGRITKKVSVTIEHALPRIDYDSLQLDKARSDDQLVASIIQFRQSHPDDSVVLVTHDTGLELKAHFHRIPAMRLPEGLRVLEEADPYRKRIQELETENRELKRAIPVLSVSFLGGGNLHKLPLTPEMIVTPEIARAHVARAIAPKFERRDPSNSIAQMDKVASEVESGQEFLANFARVARSLAAFQAQSYNADLDRYFEQYAEYLVAWGAYQNATRRIWDMPLVVGNAGTKPAQEVRIFLTVPEDLVLFPVLQAPTPPLPPGRKPQDEEEASKLLPTVGAAPSRTRVPDTLYLEKVRDGRGARELEYRLRKLNHHTEAELPTLTVGFSSHAEARPFGVDYRVVAVNTPRREIGRLNVVIEERKV